MNSVNKEILERGRGRRSCQSPSLEDPVVFYSHIPVHQCLWNIDFVFTEFWLISCGEYFHRPRVELESSVLCYFFFVLVLGSPICLVPWQYESCWQYKRICLEISSFGSALRDVWNSRLDSPSGSRIGYCTGLKVSKSPVVGRVVGY